MKFQFLLGIIFFLGITSCQSESTPESITKKFIDKMAEANCNEAKNMTTGDATFYVESIVETGCSTFDSNVKFIKCETSEETAKCDCEEERDGMVLNFSYYFKKQDGAWVISGIEGGAEPEDIVRGFMQFLADGDCDRAEGLTFGNAKSFIDEIKSLGCNSYPSKIESIECESTKESANCSVFEVKDERNFNYQFELIPGGGLGWRISAIEGGEDPGDIVEEFAKALSSGDCVLAKSISTGNARENVGASIDAGCEPYDSRIISVDCKVTENIAKCSCKEKRVGMDMTFDYDLEKVDGKWKVSNFAKDMDDVKAP